MAGRIERAVAWGVVLAAAWALPLRAESFFNNVPVTGGLILRLDASNAATINGGSPVNGAPVSSWASSVGVITATQGAPARQPIFNLNPAGTLPMRSAITFDGSATAGQGDRLGLTGLPIGNDMTAFVVARFSAQGDNAGSCCRPLFTENTSDFAANGFALSLTRPSAGSDLRFDHNGALGGVTRDIGAPDNAFHIFSVLADDASNLNTLFNNGTQLGAPQALAVNTTGTSYTIGGNLFNDARHFLGDIAEILIYDRVLTPAEHNLVGGFLTWKYGLNTAFPNFTPPAPPLAPEPGSIALLGIAVAGLAGQFWWRRRRG